MASVSLVIVFIFFDFGFEAVPWCRRPLTTSLFVHFRTAVHASHRKPEILSYKFLQQSVSRRESLPCRRFLAHAFQVSLPDLDALNTGDASAWDEAFAWLCPTVFAVAKLKL